MVSRMYRSPAVLALSSIKLLLADDHPVVRQGLRQIVERAPDITVVDEAATAAEALRLGRESQWDVMVLNLTFPDGHGLDVLASLKAAKPDAPILVFSMHLDSQLALRTLRAGAAGYISKDSAPDVVLDAIRKTAAGRRYVSGWLAEQLVIAANGDLQESPHSRLSEREFQVMLRLAAGHRVGDIADGLSLSVKTVSTYRSRILQKLGVATNAEIAVYAVRNQLLD
jgi:two-component system, NarL family, invasion response regulator UvrY